MVNIRTLILYVQFALVVGVVTASLFLRWHYALTLSHFVSFPFGSSLLGLALDADTKAKITYFQLALQAFISFISFITSALVAAQIGVILAYKGEIPYDPNPLSPLIYDKDYKLLLALLVLAIILTVIELGRFIYTLYRKNNKRS